MGDINLKLLRSKLVERISELRILIDSDIYGNQINCGLEGEIFSYQKVIEYLDGKMW